MCVEVKKDGVGFPVTKGTPDGSLVNSGDKKSSGTTRTEAVGFDALRRNVGDVVDGGGSAAEFSSDVLGGDIVGLASKVKVAI